MQFQVKMNQLGFPYRYSEEILQRRKVQQAFNSECEALGSYEMEVPLIEPLDGMIGEAPKPLRESHLNLVFHGLCYFDNKSVASAVRYEASSPIAQIVSAVNWDQQGDIKVHYMQEMVRLESSAELSATRYRSFYQMGQECFCLSAEESVRNLARQVALILSLSENIGLEAKVRISHIQISQHGIQSPQINSWYRRRMIPVIEHDSIEDGMAVISSLLLSPELRSFLIDVLHNREVDLREGLAFLKKNPALQDAYSDLLLFQQSLKEFGVKDGAVLFDAGIHRSLGFYSGIVLQADIGTVREAAGGGDFSAVMRSFSIKKIIHCSGFAIGYERIAAALKENKNKEQHALV
jgi:histidyl-tRNA synthetase